MRSHPFDVQFFKGRGQPCKPGETAASDGCIPAQEGPPSPLTGMPGAVAAGRHPPRSTVGIMEGVEAPQLPKTARGVSGLTVAEYLQDRSLKDGGELPNDDPKSLAVLSGTLADEAEWALKQDRTALGWYAKTLEEAMETVRNAYPEMRQDPNKESLYKLFLAITSQGSDPGKNTEQAKKLYDHWRTTGQVLTKEKYGGPSQVAINNNLKKVTKLIEKVGLQGLAKFLITPVRAYDLNRSGFKAGGEVVWLEGNRKKGVPNMLRGANIFGPKIGAFYSNLYGDFAPVTMDRWFMRSVGRTRGNLVGHNPELFKKQAKRLFKAVTRSKGSELMDFDKADLLRDIKVLGETGDPGKVPVLNAFMKATNAGYARDFTKKTELKRASKMYMENLSGQQVDPLNAQDRVWLRQVVGAAIDKLEAKTGRRLDSADFQALLWYYEKGLWKKLGYRAPKNEMTDYAVEAKRVYGAPQVPQAAPQQAGRVA